MAILQSYADLKAYCLEALGSPVINIEVTDAQAQSRMDDAIKYYIERHYDGVTEVYYKYTILPADVTNGYISLPREIISVSDVLTPTSSSSEAFDNIEYQFMLENYRSLMTAQVSEYYLAKQHLNLVSRMFSPEKTFQFNATAMKLTPNWKLSSVGSVNLIENSTDITLPTWTVVNATTAHDAVTGPHADYLADTFTSDAAGVFSISAAHATKTYARGTATFNVKLKSTTGNRDVTLKLTDSAGTVVASSVVSLTDLWQTFNLTGTFADGHVNDAVVVVEGTAVATGETVAIYNPWLYVNSSIIVHGFQAIDPATVINVFDDRWVGKYCTALFKKQWGSNIKKFDGVQLPGGVVMQGKAIFDEAVEEITLLEEEFALTYEEPVDFYFG